MLREDDGPERRVEKLQKITAALMQRLERIEEMRGPAYALTRTRAVLEREILARNRDLEEALADLAEINTELALAREVADEANRAKSRFLRAASHDLLQPLSAAKLFLSHLSDLSGNREQRDLVSHLTATIDSAEELIRALSNIAKLDSANFQMNRAPVAMGRLFRRLIIDMQPLANVRGIDLRFEASSATVESDPVYLRQIAQNLITNALKYTTGRKVLVGVRRAGPEAVWLEVLDRGPGIAARDQDRIFNEFERLSRNDQPGTGLGLSIVRRACQQLGHPLELRSEPGRGSRFRVHLPRAEASNMPGEPEQIARIRRISESAFAGRKVLVVENDPSMRRAYSVLLGGWGMKVRALGGIELARNAAGADAPDLVLTDYRLDAGETGIAALLALREDMGRMPPALIISAESAGAIRAELVEAGLGARIEVLEKPVSEPDLRRSMLAALLAGG